MGFLLGFGEGRGVVHVHVWFFVLWFFLCFSP